MCAGSLRDPWAILWELMKRKRSKCLTHLIYHVSWILIILPTGPALRMPFPWSPPWPTWNKISSSYACSLLAISARSTIKPTSCLVIQSCHKHIKCWHGKLEIRFESKGFEENHFTNADLLFKHRADGSSLLQFHCLEVSSMWIVKD